MLRHYLYNKTHPLIKNISETRTQRKSQIDNMKEFILDKRLTVDCWTGDINSNKTD